ncbi:nucleoside transporter [Salmonella enterica]|nr:nucleoside transporter [Salmonella enterica]
MKEGIYTVVFESSQQSVGEGVVVINNGRVHGGDMAFTIRGIMKRPVMEEDYWLEMSYREAGEGRYVFSGHVKGHPERMLKACAVFLTPLLK